MVVDDLGSLEVMRKYTMAVIALMQGSSEYRVASSKLCCFRAARLQAAACVTVFAVCLRLICKKTWLTAWPIPRMNSWKLTRAVE